MKKLLIIALIIIVGCDETTESNGCVNNYENLFCDSLIGDWELIDYSICEYDCLSNCESANNADDIDLSSSIMTINSNYTYNLDFIVFKEDSSSQGYFPVAAESNSGTYSIDSSQICLNDFHQDLYCFDYNFENNRLMLSSAIDSTAHQCMILDFNKKVEDNSNHYDYNFPLVIGNSWSYNYYKSYDCFEDTLYQIPKSIPSSICSLDTIHAQILMTLTDRKYILDSLDVYELELKYNSGDSTFYKFVYLNENETGLNLFALKQKNQFDDFNLYGDVLPRFEDALSINSLNNFFYIFSNYQEQNNYECDGYVYTHFNTPLRALKYPIELNTLWIYLDVNMDYINTDYNYICEDSNEIIQSDFHRMLAVKQYTNYENNCFETQTYATLPNLANDLDYLFIKQYCDYGIESINRIYKFGQQIGMDEQGNPIGGSYYTKLTESFELIEHNIP